MIDYAARIQLCELIDDYLNDRLTAFEFDERIFDIRRASRDHTVRFVVDQLWCCYDDCDDHLVVLDKTAWDTIQRLRLLLLSGERIRVERQRILHFSQCVAVITLAGIGWVCSIHWQSWPLAVIPAGLISCALWKWRERSEASYELPDPSHAWPFKSPAPIARAYRRIAAFRKQQFRPEIAPRRIRSDAQERAIRMQSFFTSLTLSPLLLLLQTLPLTTTHASVDEQA